MKFSNITLTSAMLLALAACGGGGGEPVDPNTVTSSGILELDLPADTSAYPEGVDDLITSVKNANELGTLEAPAGEAVYTGTFGAEINDFVGGDGAVITGDATIGVNLSATTATATFDNISAISVDSQGTVFPSVDGSITEDSPLTISAGILSGDLTGSFLVEGSETYDFAGALNGAFADENGTNSVFGVFDGTLTNTTVGDDFGVTDEVGGAFYATEN